jgi:hypothetical protein
VGPTCQSLSLRTGPACQRAVATWLPRARAVPRLKGAVGTERVRPNSRPHPDHAPPPTASPHAPPTATVRSRAIVHSRPHVFDAPRHQRRPATPAASALVVAEPHVPAPSSTPRRSDAAVADSAGKPWCRRLRSATVPYARRCLYRELAPCRCPHVGEAPPCRSPHCSRAHAHAGPTWARLWLRTLCRPRPSRARLGRARCAGRLRRLYATGPREDLAQWHLI